MPVLASGIYLLSTTDQMRVDGISQSLYYSGIQPLNISEDVLAHGVQSSSCLAHLDLRGVTVCTIVKGGKGKRLVQRCTS